MPKKRKEIGLKTAGLLATESRSGSGALTATELQDMFHVLKTLHPEYFKSAEISRIFWMVMEDCGQELRALYAFEKFNLINKIMALMCDMGRAGVVSVADKSPGASMFRTFIAERPEWKKKRDAEG